MKKVLTCTLIALLLIPSIMAISVRIKPYPGDSSIASLTKFKSHYQIKGDDAKISTEFAFLINQTDDYREGTDIVFDHELWKNQDITYFKDSIQVCKDAECEDEVSSTININETNGALTLNLGALSEGEYYVFLDYSILSLVHKDGFFTYFIWLNYNDHLNQLSNEVEYGIEIRLEDSGMVIKDIFSESYKLNLFDDIWQINFNQIDENAFWYEDSENSSPALWAVIGAIIGGVISMVVTLLIDLLRKEA